MSGRRKGEIDEDPKVTDAKGEGRGPTCAFCYDPIDR